MIVAPDDITALTDAELEKLAFQVLNLQESDRQQNQLRYYKPVSKYAKQIHTSIATTIGIGGGNGASKTDTALAEMVIRATGQVPLSLATSYPRSKLRGPIACRVVVESLTTTLYPTILPKLQWTAWSGVSAPGGDQGHWGWIPRHCLIDGDWKHSWTDRLRLLRLYYRDPENPDRVIGESKIQFMSYDQDASDFSSGDFHFVLHDEPPKFEIWRENRARVMRVNGTLMLSMTWPDDPAIPIDWLFDEIYDKGIPGPAKDPGIDWFNLFSTDNPNLNQSAVAERAAQMSDTERAVRIYGQPIRFSNRIHPLFTDQPRHWCHVCGDDVIPIDGVCSKCDNEVIEFTHVNYQDVVREYPCVFVIDPHPRKPHCLSWTQINPNDDLYQVHELQISEGPEGVRDAVEAIEADYGWTHIRRLIDPNMGRSPSGTNREITWQDEFDRVELRCDLADDSAIGRSRFNDYLKPDSKTDLPRWVCHPRCTTTVLQLKRYTWADRKNAEAFPQKQEPNAKNDDFPQNIKYLLNSDPSFRGVRDAGRVFRRPGRSAMGY